MNGKNRSRKKLRELIREDFDLETILAHVRPYYENFDAWRKEHFAFLDFVRRQGYEFRSLEDFERTVDGDGNYSVDGRYAYLRYDIHVHDLFFAFGLSELHAEQEVPAIFYITWDYSKRDERLREQFSCLKKLNTTYTRFGLHAAPASSWFLEEYLEGAGTSVRSYVNSAEIVEYVQKLEREVDDHGRDGSELTRIREGAERHLKMKATSFREYFPEATTVSGHGNPISARIRSLLSKDKKYQCVRDLFHAPLFLAEDKIRPLGYRYETTFVGRCWKCGPIMLYDGSPPKEFMKSIVTSAEKRLPIVPLIHPRRFHDRCFAGVFSG